MNQLLVVVQHRQGFAAQYRQLKRHRAWLVELERRLDPPDHEGQPRPTPSRIQRQVKDFLVQLEHHAPCHAEDAAVVAHICTTFRQRWPRLFACYAWPDRYRTNNALETFFGRLRTRQRQIHGRKSVHEFILRYGEWAVFIDPTETFDQVLQRVQQFEQVKFDQEYARFLKAQRRIQILYRFRHRAGRCLKDLEQQWAEATRHKSR